MPYIVAIANAKGGVAKTTTALSLGASLVENGQSVLLVDLDPHANLTLSLGLKPPELRQSLADVLMGSQPVSAILLNTEVAGLDLAPANHELTMAEGFLVVRENYELLLSQTLTSIEGYDTVVLDCPPTLGPLTRSALSAADLLIIPTQPEFFSAHGLRDMLNQIRAVRQRTNPGLRYRLLLTMLDRRNRIHRNLAQHIRTAFSDAVFDTVIETDTRLRESPVFGQPITIFAPNSRAAAQYRDLAQELRKYTDEIARSSTQPA